MNKYHYSFPTTIILQSIAIAVFGLTGTAFSAEHGRHVEVRSHGSGSVRVERHFGNNHYVHSARPQRHYHAGFSAGFSLPLPPVPFGHVVVSLPGTYRTYHCSNRPYYWSNGVFYTRHVHGYEVVSAPRIRFIPEHARRVVIGGTVYFEYDGGYYSYRNGYYELCPPPVAAEKGPEKTVVMVENSNGSRTPVELEPLGENQWKGPRGEIYSGLPSNDQLRDGYGF
jgi:hypothetical protein